MCAAMNNGACSERINGRLTAVLLNPPTSTSGVRSRNAVHRAAVVLGYGSVEIVNLCSLPTRSVIDLDEQEDQYWAAARPDILQALERSCSMLGAWGIAGLTGATRALRDRQVEWLYATAVDRGLTAIWMVGAKPRHPSRWHQYLSDKYGRTSGGSSAERLKEALVSVALPIGPRDPSAE